MTLSRFEIFRYAVPLGTPLTLAGVRLRKRAGLLVRLEANGTVGWGEAAPLPGFSRETLADAAAALASLEYQALPLSDAPLNPDSAAATWLDQQRLPASARFAVEGALWHLAAERQGRSLAHVSSPAPRATVSLNGLLLGALEDMLTEAQSLRAAGYLAVKLKVGRRPIAEDLARVRAVAGVLGPSVALRLDANRAWTFDEAAAFADGVADIPLDYIEEPLADAARLPAFAAQSPLPVALDETMMDLGPDDLAAHTYARAVVLKPTLLGGLVPARRLARRAEMLGLVPVLSAAFEAGVATRALIAFATLLPDVPAGLDPYHRLADDVLAPPLAWSGGQVDVAALLGTRRTIRPDLLTPLDDS